MSRRPRRPTTAAQRAAIYAKLEPRSKRETRALLKLLAEQGAEFHERNARLKANYRLFTALERMDDADLVTFPGMHSGADPFARLEDQIAARTEALPRYIDAYSSPSHIPEPEPPRRPWWRVLWHTLRGRA